MKEEQLAAKTEMLIRKPIDEVFEAFVDPATTTKFWFTKSSGRLQKGADITWTWEMYDHSIQIKVLELEQSKQIVIEWGAYDDPTTVTWDFQPYEDTYTFVSVTNSGFKGDKAIANALDSTSGFTMVLAGLKAYLEHGVELNLIRDRYPVGLREH
jgi:uncharacterized protein YndB with AHSA1/START domain